MGERHETLLRREDAILLVIDFQERMVDALPRAESVSAEVLRLIPAMKQMEIPIIATEQYSKGLGPTVEAVRKELDLSAIVEKMTFSCCGAPKFWELLKSHQRRQVVVVGVEAHVCVLQTALDLIANGYQVHLPVEAVCSRSDANRDNALRRMNHAGVILTNSESVLFELMVEAGTELFKSVRKFIV